jgi:hypothetical protein
MVLLDKLFACDRRGAAVHQVLDALAERGCADSPPVRSHIISLTAAHRVPALHSQREFDTMQTLVSLTDTSSPAK